MPKNLFNVEAFYSSLDAERQSRKLNWKQVAQEAGVSASTFTRMAQGKRPDIDTAAALCNWSGLTLEDYFPQKTNASQPDTLATISGYLRADRNLSPESADALEAILRVAYEKLREGSVEDSAD